LALSLLFAGCSQEKNTIVNRTYHNVTSHYNGFFNGRLALKDAHTAMKTSYEEDYTQLFRFLFMLSQKLFSQFIQPWIELLKKHRL